MPKDTKDGVYELSDDGQATVSRLLASYGDQLEWAELYEVNEPNGNHVV